MPPVALMAPM